MPPRRPKYEVQPESVFASVPEEILDYICGFIEESADLLHFVVNKKLGRIIIPNRLHYRTLRCGLSRPVVWKNVALIPGIAAKFTTLVIQKHEQHGYDYTSIPELAHGSLVPPRLLEGYDPARPPEDESMKLLITAVQHMTSLTNLTVPLFKRECDVLGFFAALRTHCRIRNFKFWAAGPWSHYDYTQDVQSYSSLHDLREFSLLGEDGEDHVFPEFRATIVDALISHSPQLEALTLQMELKDFLLPPQLLAFTGWPGLNSVYLHKAVGKGHREHPLSHLFAEFLHRHPTLKHLGFCQCISPTAITLPDLRTLVAPVWELITLEGSSFPKLEFLWSGLDLIGKGVLQHLGERYPALHALSVNCTDLKRVPRKPRLLNVERLRLDLVDCEDDKIEPEIDSSKASLDLWIKVLKAAFPNLTHLAGIPARADARGVENILPRIAAALPKLRHLQLAGENRGPCIVLQRSAKGKYEGWELADAQTMGEWLQFYGGNRDFARL